MKYEDTTIERLNFLLEENARLRDENKRLREALENLMEESAALLPNGSHELKQARTALQGVSDETDTD